VRGFFLSPLLFLLGGVCFSAQARVFIYQEHHVAAVLEGAFGSTLMNQDGFSANMGNGVDFSDRYQFMTSGKLGMSFKLGGDLQILVAAEIMKPLSVKDVRGKNASGVEYYQFSSSAFVLNPMAQMEWTYSYGATWRSFFFGGMGMGRLMMENKFDMTPDGATDLGVASYTEKMRGDALNGMLGFGFETYFVDSSTFVFKVGQRLFKVYKLTHTNDAVTVAEGSVSDGDTVHNADGSNRHVDLSGPFVEMGFRFYIP
jgi:hypothetical protein